MVTTDIHGVVTAMPVRYLWAEPTPGGSAWDVDTHHAVLPPLRVWATSPSWGAPIRAGDIVPAHHQSLSALLGLVAGPPGHHVPLLTLGGFREGMPVRTMCACDWRATWSGPGAQQLAHVAHRLQHSTAGYTTSPVYPVGRTRTDRWQSARPDHRMYGAEQSMPSHGTRSVLLCECGEWAAGAAEYLRSWLAEHDGRYAVRRPESEERALRLAVDRDARTEAHLRARRMALGAGRITYADLGERLADHGDALLLSLPERTVALEAVGVSADYVATVLGIDVATLSDRPAIPDGWVDVGATTDSSAPWTPQPRETLDSRLDRAENTAAGIRAALERIDAADRAGSSALNTSDWDGARWSPDLDQG